LTGQRFVSPVPPGTGWPDDPATPATPVAAGPDDVRRLALGAAESPQLQPNDMFSAEKHVTTPQLRDSDQPPTLTELDALVSVCRACPRLVRWREDVAVEKRAAYAGEPYWGRPIAGWGDPVAAVLIVGLAPAAHGGNRTGRIFTGDRSGDWLFAALHRAGLAAQEDSVHAGDGQRLVRARMVAAVRCAPPQNKPTTAERDTCSPWIEREITLLAPHVRVVVALGSFGWDAALRAYRSAGYAVPSPRPRFGHGAEAGLVGPAGEPVTLLGCYHPSQQNTFTGKLTEAMLDDVLGRAQTLAG
jgi:uracil-DNA glycosylase family 4